MVSRKSATPDLIAIYRLEFYRKQKNWKFSAPKPKDKPPKHERDTFRNLLNATYNVDDNPNNQDPLNEAFCELELDQKPSLDSCKTNLQIHKKLSQDWLEPINIWPDNVKKKTQTTITNTNIPNQLGQVSYKGVCGDDFRPPPPKKTWIHERLEVLMQAAKDRDLEVQSEPALDLPQDELEQDLNQKFEPEVEYEFDCDKNGGMNWDWMECSRDNEDRGIWSEPGWMDTAQLMEDAWQRDYDVANGLGDAAPAGAWPADTDADESLDSAGEFMRGAHVAPHSSELELAAPPMSGREGARALCSLSASQLAAAVRSQSQLLARLLREAARRRTIQQSLSIAACSDFSLDECPTRDAGPSCPPAARDALLAGSHRPGRGRGRLP